MQYTSIIASILHNECKTRKKVYKFLLTFYTILVIIYKSPRVSDDGLRKCRNWQTSKTKDLVMLTSCGFKSHLPHETKGISSLNWFLFCFVRKRHSHPAASLRGFPGNCCAIVRTRRGITSPSQVPIFRGGWLRGTVKKIKFFWFVATVGILLLLSL